MRCLSAVAIVLSIAGPLLSQTHFPPPPAPPGNVVTANKALLGMALFWDEQMSATDTVACGTCHRFGNGGVDPRTGEGANPGSDGVFGTADDIHGSPGVATQSAARTFVGSAQFGFGEQITRRRAPSVVNAGYQPALFYDGRASSGQFVDPEAPGTVVLAAGAQLENLCVQPPVNAVEMGFPGRTWTDIAQKIAAARPLALASDLPPRLAAFVGRNGYPQLFQVAFGTAQVSAARIVMALATYIRTLDSDEAPYDYVRLGLLQLTPLEARGLSLFNAPMNGAVACATCHGDFTAGIQQTGPVVGALTTTTTGYYGSPQQTRLLFHNVGVRPNAEDPGRQAITGASSDAGKFRVATLRNVTLSAPYFHNGSKKTLLEVLDFYDRGGDYHVNQSPSLTSRKMTAADREALLALLATLTDPRVALEQQPFDRPHLGSENGALPQSVGPGSQLPDGTRARMRATVASLGGVSDFHLVASGIPAGAWTLLMWDPFSLQWSVGITEFALSMSPFLQVVSTGLPTADPRAGTSVAVTFALPAAPALRGTVVYGQWMFTEPTGFFGIATTNGIRIELR